MCRAAAGGQEGRSARAQGQVSSVEDTVLYRNVQKHQAVLGRSQHIVYKKEQYTITAWQQRVRGSITRTMQSQLVVEYRPSVVTHSTATGRRRATYARAIRARRTSQEIATGGHNRPAVGRCSREDHQVEADVTGGHNRPAAGRRSSEDHQVEEDVRGGCGRETTTHCSSESRQIEADAGGRRGRATTARRSSENRQS